MAELRTAVEEALGSLDAGMVAGAVETLREALATDRLTKSVPREPTQEMLDAVKFKPHPTRPNGWADRHAEMWRRMWDAAGVAAGDCGNAECGWRGPLSKCCYVGSVGPCCPDCREIVEPDAPGVMASDEPCKHPRCDCPMQPSGLPLCRGAAGALGVSAPDATHSGEFPGESQAEALARISEGY